MSVNKIESQVKCDISIIIPIYNGERFIEQTLKSAFNAGVDSLQVIVVDDGSVDNSVSIVNDFSTKNNVDILVTTNRNSKGVSGARNTGIELAEGEYIAFLDADDILLPGSLKYRFELAKANPEYGLVATDFVEFSDDNPITSNSKGYCSLAFERLGFNKVPKSYIEERPIEFFLKYFCVISMCSVLVKSVCLKKKFQFDESMTHGEDEDLWYRISFVNKLLIDSTVTTGYRKHANSATMDKTKKILGACKLRKTQLSSMFRKEYKELALLKMLNEFYSGCTYHRKNKNWKEGRQLILLCLTNLWRYKTFWRQSIAIIFRIN